MAITHNTQSLSSPELDRVLGFVATFMDLRATPNNKAAKQATYQLQELFLGARHMGDIVDI
eukprot:1315458-Prorocentrum_lima.AAC.1